MTRGIFFICLILSFTNILCDSELRQDCNYFEKIKQQACNQLTASNGNQCVLINGSCQSKKQFSSCAAYNGENPFENEVCESITASSYEKKCIVETEGNTKTCKEVYKTCSDYNWEIDCSNLMASDGKHCVLINDKCEEHFDKCEEAGNNCNSNYPLNSQYKCISKGGKCILPEFCSDYIYDEDHEKYGLNSACSQLSPETDKTKVCGFLNKKCEEHFKSCEDYKGTKQDECEAIIPMTSYWNGNKEIYQFNYGKKCIFNSTLNKCTEEDRVCSDYKEGQDEYFCYSSVDNDGNSCKLYGNKCLKRYDDCEDYKEKDKEICENIEPDESDYSKRCVFKDDKCVSEEIKCSDITSRSDCNDIILKDSNKRCTYAKNKCVEMELMDSSTTIEGISQSVCESIIPYTSDQYGPYKYDDFSKKTYYDSSTKKCSVVPKTCKEFNYETDSEDLCEQLTAEKGDKCVLFNNNCYEAYSKCEQSAANSEETCKAIMTVNYFLEKCVFENNNCVTKSRTCDDYNVDNLKDYCENIFPFNEVNKCSYSQGSCSESPITCSEIEKISDGEVDFNDELCGLYSVSNSKNKCVATEDKSSCVEKENISKVLNNHFSLFFIIAFLLL